MQHCSKKSPPTPSVCSLNPFAIRISSSADIFLWNLPWTSLLITIVEGVAKFLGNAFREINIYLVTGHDKIMTAWKEPFCVRNVLLFSRKYICNSKGFFVLLHMYTNCIISLPKAFGELNVWVEWFVLIVFLITSQVFSYRKEKSKKKVSLISSILPIDSPYRFYLFLSLFFQNSLTLTYFSNEAWELSAVKRKVQGKTANFLERTILNSSPFDYSCIVCVRLLGKHQMYLSATY